MAVGALEAAYQVLFDYELTADLPVADTQSFLSQLGRPEKAAHRVPWTAGLVRRGLGVYAALAEEPPDWLAGEVRKRLAAERRRQARTARRREARATGLAERLSRQPGWRAADGLIPRAGVDDRIARYEAHLSKQRLRTGRGIQKSNASRVPNAWTVP